MEVANMDDADSSALSSCSSPLSMLSRSPTPPCLDGDSFITRKSYPSPSSSQESSQSSSPCPEAMADAAREDEQPPAKRRRLGEPKPRTTLSLDLGSSRSIEEQQPQLERLLKVLHKKRKIVVIAGAGISVSAGIPDFRSSTGLFKSLKSEHNLKSSGKDLFDASVYKDDNSTQAFHNMVRNLSQDTKNAQPTGFHHMLATLAHENRLLRLYTQNVDGLDTALPPLATRVPLRREEGTWPKTVQLHGGLDKMVCVKCHTLSDFEPDLFDGPVPPLCRACEASDNVRTEHAGKRSHGIGRMRPRMVLYNEHNPDDEAIGSITRADLRARPDAVIVVGTTLKVPGVKRIAREMCNVVRDRRDGLTVWINNDNPPPGKDLEWDLIVKGPCDEVARHAALRKWDDEFVEVSDEQMRKAREHSVAEVIVVSPAKSKTFEQVLGVPTPVASPKFQAKTTKLLPTAAKKQSTISLASTTNPGEKKATGKSKATNAPKVAAAAATTKRKRGPAKKTEEKSGKIHQTFKISKSKAAAPVTAVKAGAKVEQPKPQRKQSESMDSVQVKKPSALQPQQQLQHKFKQENFHEIATGLKQPQTPRKQHHLASLSTSAPMAPLSPTDLRNNSSPQAPLYSPLTMHKESRSKSLELTRVPSSPIPIAPRRASGNIGTISPTGAIPKGMSALIDTF